MSDPARGAGSGAPDRNPPPHPEAADTPDARVEALADEYVAGYLDRYPETRTTWGIPGSEHGRLHDNSLGAHRRWEAREDAWLAEARAFDAKAFRTRSAWLTHAVLVERLEATVELRCCRQELWDVNQLNGWHTGLTHLARIQPVDTPERRDQALERWRAMPGFVEREVEKLREGLRLGYSAPERNVRLVVEQLDALLSTPVAETPFRGPADRAADGAFADALEGIVAREIYPALTRYRDYLAGEYVSRARKAIPVTVLPGGDACYPATVRYFSTLEMDPEEIHALGLRQIERIEEEMRSIAGETFGTTEVGEVLDRLKSDPEHTFSSREEIIEYARAALDRARGAVPEWFDLLPEADVVIERYPEYLERSEAGEYNAPAEDGSRPGVFRISTYDPEERSRSFQEAIAFHETIPGHHLQTALALERAGEIHPIARYFFNSGYVEGWALYAERLADEMGLYSSPVDRMGMLSSQALRAARLVVDPGIHVLGWSREEAIAYMEEHTTSPPAEVRSEVDRYIVWPGQATSYMLGMMEMRRLREMAEEALGGAFDIRRYHDRVLEDGSLPLSTLRRKIEGWIEEGGRDAGRPVREADGRRD